MDIHMDGLSVYEIKKWIEELFCDEEIDIPDLEGNYDCMKILSKVISANKEAEKDVNEIIKTESYLAQYYAQKGEDLSNSFSASFCMSDLQPDIAENIEKISSIAAQMKLKEPTITNFLLGSCALDNQKERHTEQEMLNAYTLTKFSKKITDLMQKNGMLESDIEILEKKVLKQQNISSGILEKSKFFQVKGEEYKMKKKKIEKQLKNLGWKPSLSHSELVKRSETVQDLENKVNSLTEKLESYQNLPPNEVLTKFKIEEAQAELLKLQNEFDDLLKVIC